MAVNTQPSILTVCVPGAADRGTLERNEEILCSREQAPASAAKCDASDDSACGMDPLGDCASRSNAGSTSGPSERLVLGDEASSGAAGNRAGASGTTPSFFHADSGKKALELLRMLRFDLLVTGDQLPDMPVGHLIRRVRAAWPWQKWAMVGSVLTAQDEIAARTLGAMAVFDAPPDWEALALLAAAAAGKTAAASDLGRAEMEKAGATTRLVGAGDEAAIRPPAQRAKPKRAVAVAG